MQNRRESVDRRRRGTIALHCPEVILNPSGGDATQGQPAECRVLYVVFEAFSFAIDARPWTAISEPPLTQLGQADFRVGRDRLAGQPVLLSPSFLVLGPAP